MDGRYISVDRLLAHKAALKAFLYARERDLFDLNEVITLYDLSNTYFEGTTRSNANAAFGKSKEKRSDCPLVTLALVLDAGIATEENIAWVLAHGYRYVMVSRRRHREFDPEAACLIK